MTKTAASPDLIFRQLGQYLSAKYLMVAEELGIFEALANGPLPAKELAIRLGLPVKTVRILANALTTTGILVSEDDCFRNSDAAGAFLGVAAGGGLRPIVRMWGDVVDHQWRGLARAIRTGNAQCGWADLSPSQQQVFAEGIEALTLPSAKALAQNYDFSQHHSLLDLAGGTGSFLLSIRQRYPTLKAALFERPEAAEPVRDKLETMNVETFSGDLLHDPVPEGFDCILVANAVHLFSPENNHQLLNKIRAAVAKGSRLLLVDFWMEAGHLTPEFGALLAGEFLIVSGGDVYSACEVKQWLGTTGWQFIQHMPLAGAASLIVAEANT